MIPTGPPPPRRFFLDRHTDVSGVSGVGVVAEGVQFSDGTVALRWRGATPATSVWDTGLAAMLAVHGHGGGSTVAWIDPPRPNPLSSRQPALSVNGLCGVCLGAWPCTRCPDARPAPASP